MSNKLDIRYLNLTSATAPYRFSHEGYAGGSEVKTFVIKSNSNQHVYTDIKASVTSIAGEEILAADFFTENGWSIKLLVKNNESVPTEEDWAEVFPNTSVMLEDIGGVDDSGITSIPDTNTKQYLSIRVFCPGHSEPGQYEHNISLSYNSINVSSF